MSKLSKLMLERDTRIELCRRSKKLFAIYYFSNYFTHTIPKFHEDIYGDLNDDELDFLVLC